MAKVVRKNTTRRCCGCHQYNYVQQGPDSILGITCDFCKQHTICRDCQVVEIEKVVVVDG